MLRRILIGGHRPHVGLFDEVGQVEHAAAGGLLDQIVKDVVNDVFEVREEAINRISGRRSIEPVIEPTKCTVNSRATGADGGDVLVVAM